MLKIYPGDSKEPIISGESTEKRWIYSQTKIREQFNLKSVYLLANTLKITTQSDNKFKIDLRYSRYEQEECLILDTNMNEEEVMKYLKRKKEDERTVKGIVEVLEKAYNIFRETACRRR